MNNNQPWQAIREDRFHMTDSQNDQIFISHDYEKGAIREDSSLLLDMDIKKKT